MMDCAVIGGGPAGLSAALTLGRARRSVVVLDEGKPRNAAARTSHGFLTRDGIDPHEFRRIAQEEIRQYPSVEIRKARVVEVIRHGSHFEVVTEAGERIPAKKILLATGLKDILPDIDGMPEFYGKSLFNCPYCDGWELRDQPLVVISEGKGFDLARIVWNWSHDLLVCTNGQSNLTEEEKERLERKGIRVRTQRIRKLEGKDGKLERVVFEDGEVIERVGGFVNPKRVPASPLAESLGCQLNKWGGMVTDPLGRTSVKGVYAAGDAVIIAPAKAIIAAAGGSRAAVGVNTDLSLEEF